MSPLSRRHRRSWRVLTTVVAWSVLALAGVALSSRQWTTRPVATGDVVLSPATPPPSPPGTYDIEDEADDPGAPLPVTVGQRGGVVVPILVYHYVRINPVASDRVGFNLSVTPQHFAQQMQLLHDVGAHTITLADLVQAMTTGTPLPPHPVVLTFDDGYADFATEAAPIMRVLGLRGTDFVVSGFIGRPNYMTAQQILRVQAMGMVIGAHTVHHVALAHVPLAVARTEIDLCRQQLRALTHTSVDDFAYPYGDLDSAVVALVQQAGFRDAVSMRPGVLHTLGERYVLSRERVGGTDTLASFAVKAGVPLVPLHPAPQLAALERGVGSPATPPSPSPLWPGVTAAVADVDRRAA